jgi:2-dehydropantoate 2-reductase
VEPGVVEPGGAGGISIGDQPRIAALVDLLCDSGFPVEVIADTLGLQWGKAIINAAINPLTALLRVKNGELVARPSLRVLMSDTAHEAEAVANAVGVELPYPDPVAVVESVARKTGANTSSMLSDVLRGAPTEIDSINGAIVQAGEEAGVPAPVNRTLWQLVKGLEHPTT